MNLRINMLIRVVWKRMKMLKNVRIVQHFSKATLVIDAYNQLFIHAKDGGLLPLLTQNGEMIFAVAHPSIIGEQVQTLRKKD